jgi:hypothetical protein
LDANTASNNVFYVTVVSNATSCLGNQPGDITGRVEILVNPRPRAVLNSFTNTVCEGATETLSVELTGIGPWRIWWNDGFEQTTNSTSGSGPLTLTRTVTPQRFNLNTVTTNGFYITNVVDAHCTAWANDITGWVEILVTPCLTIWLQNQTNVVLSWVGNWWLLSSGDLTNSWTNVIQGALSSTNYWTNPVTGTQQFFRLMAPTNSP